MLPEVHWDWCSESVMVMERMHGTPISQVDALRDKGVDIPQLARGGVEIFFTQVFRDGFFHADMHPGNIFVCTEGPRKGQYIALDFGIVGTLSDSDKNYLAQNFLAFFRRDYKRVAEAHIESGWAPKDTRVDEFEAAIRAVCEPFFDRPLKEISLGPRAAAVVPDLAPVQCRDSAATGAAAKDPAQCRGPGPRTRSRTRLVADRLSLPRTLDERATGPAGAGSQPEARGRTVGTPAADPAAPGAPGLVRHRARRRPNPELENLAAEVRALRHMLWLALAVAVFALGFALS
jgi:hypothetical protein